MTSTRWRLDVSRLGMRRPEATSGWLTGLAIVGLLTTACFGQTNAPAASTTSLQSAQRGSEAIEGTKGSRGGAEKSAEASSDTAARIFLAHGIVRNITNDGRTVEIQHDAITNYMPAMTMPFKVASGEDLEGLRVGDEISFRLLVNEDESWVDRIKKTSQSQPVQERVDVKGAAPLQRAARRHPLMDYKFTNQLGQAVSLAQFHGQALAITFFFTRCPIPNFCPRLSKNFEQASSKLADLPNAPTNWHFLSVSFDTEFDTPAVLRTYAESYHYDPKHWSFLTGPADKIAELARLSDVTMTREGSLFNHNFRTLIIDAAGHLQMAFPIGGNLADAIVEQVLKAAMVSDHSVPPAAGHVAVAAGNPGTAQR